MRGLQKVNELRKPTEGEKLSVEIIQLNVITEVSASNAIELVLADKGKIDVLVYNGGYGIGGCFEDLSIDEMIKQFETNFYALK
jgi:short-subunit dehydrogenase